MRPRFYFRVVGMVLGGVLCCSIRSACQVQVGENVLLNLDGGIAGSYSGGFANDGPSSHGIGFGGNGNLSGSYYSPQFLSFNISPFYNQSRDSSSFNSMVDSSGVNARANIFGGSRFPGYVSYTRLYNNETTYLLPGIANFKINGNSQTFGIGWSANVVDLPSLTVGYQQTSSDSSLYGTQSDSLSHFHSILASSTYQLDGFHLSGGINHSNGNSQFPQIVAGQPIQTASSDSTTYTFNVGRTVFLEGNTWVSFTRNTTGYDSPGLSNSQTSDVVTGGLALKPTGRLNTQISADYNDSLAGAIYQAVNTSGVAAPVSIPAGASHSWGLFGGAQYAVFRGLYVGGTISHREQLFLGNTYDSTAYSGSVNFGHDLLGGQFSAGAIATRSTLPSNGESMLGFLSNATYIRRIGAWNVSGGFSYSENVQTILISYTSSGYGYSASVSRRFGKLNWNGTASGSKNLISQAGGTGTFTQSYSTGLSCRWVGVSGAYGKSSGTGLLTPSGIAQSPPGVPPELLPTAVFFGGNSYSLGVASTPMPGLSLNATYLKAQYSTESGTFSSNNRTEQLNAYLRYRFRKVYFIAGYSRLVQGFSASNLPPLTVSGYYFGISRWFKFF